MKKIHVTTLGCPKNVVDSEHLLGLLKINDFQISQTPEESDVLIINTCGFINDAKEESIQAILEALELKKSDPHKKVFVAGCLTQRYRKEIEQEIPEVDAIFGTEEYSAILKALGKGHASMDNFHRTRLITTPRHYAYLKISEGCNHTCAFCAIPGIRGRHRSKPIEKLVEEARVLADNGTKELIVVSQDTSYYGKDLYGEQKIVPLLQALEQVEGLEWIRVLYWYPTNFPMDVLHWMRDSQKLVHYLDLPIQHISDHVLRQMRRGDTRKSILNILQQAKKLVPDVTFRTTVIVGHPGERRQDFDELLRFVEEIRFDRLGSFIYSDEDGTAAFDLPDKVDEAVARQRQEQLMEIQREISLEKNRKMIGKSASVLIDEYNSEMNFYLARTYKDAPEIDNEVIILNQSKQRLKVGQFQQVEIIDATEYELYGKTIS
ncbi:MAG: 30S ribosomal protein S12 methylthiotransferase RimO [Caldisericaceae bacterium]|nr:30S ribosomal protein S12 methylthiotransferase RimO [Caldisericaceae bacterium]